MPFAPPTTKGSTLSDLTAAKEYGIPRAELQQAIRAGKLSYQINSMHGNPWFRLIRKEVEAFCSKRIGAKGLREQQNRTAIAKAEREIRQLQKRIATLQEQVADWKRKG
jgi:hypothetical protein